MVPALGFSDPISKWPCFLEQPWKWRNHPLPSESLLTLSLCLRPLRQPLLLQSPPSTYHVILLPVLPTPAPGLAQPLMLRRCSSSTEEELVGWRELHRCGSLETYQRDCLPFPLLCSNGNSFNTIQTWILRIIVLFTYQLTAYLITLPHPHPHMCADVCAMKCIASCTDKSIGAPCYLSIA